MLYNVRLGCTYLTLDTLLTVEEQVNLIARGSKALLEASVARGTSIFPPSTFQGPNGRVLAQISSDASIMSGNVALTVSVGPGSLAAPRVSSVIPFAALPGDRRGFTLLGGSVAGSQDMVVCRRGGAMPNLDVLRSGKQSSSAGAAGAGPSASPFAATGAAFAPAAEDGGEEYVEFVVPSLVEGLHFVEVQRGALLSSSAPFVVVDNAEAVAELRQLEYDASGVGDSDAIASFLRSVGLVLDWNRNRNGESTPSTSSGAAAAAAAAVVHGPASAARIASISQRVVATCVSRGWPALLRLILPAMVAPGDTCAAAVDGIKAFSAQGLSLLHLVATSRCAATIPVLAEWSAAVGHSWKCEGAGASKLTPLHLAALLDDGGAMASALTSLFVEGMLLWETKHAVDGATPADFVVGAGNTKQIEWLASNGITSASLKNPIVDPVKGSSGGGAPYLEDASCSKRTNSIGSVTAADLQGRLAERVLVRRHYLISVLVEETNKMHVATTNTHYTNMAMCGCVLALGMGVLALLLSLRGVKI